jgi:hypothetical protein
MLASTRRICARGVRVAVHGARFVGLIAATAMVANSSYELITRNVGGTTSDTNDACEPDDLLTRLHLGHPDIARAALTAALGIGVVAAVVPLMCVDMLYDRTPRHRSRSPNLSTSALVSSTTTSL